MQNVIYSFIVALLLSSSALLAQDGVIIGKVYDAETSETLIAAYVEVVGMPEIVEATDFDGNFTIKVPPGTYSLKATYIGYSDMIIEDIEVTAGKEEFIDFAMGTNNQVLDEVVVTAKAVRNTENYILLERKKSDKIQDGIGRRELSQSGVSNVAGAMTKVTGISVTDGKHINVRGLGDRYSVTQLNGVELPSIDPYRNSAQLDLIPSNLVENLVVSKTFTPDLPGNFTGGLLDVETRDFPETQVITVSYSANYNTFTTFNEDFLTFDDGVSTDWLGYGTKDRAMPDILMDPEIEALLGEGVRERINQFNVPQDIREAQVEQVNNAARSLDYEFDTLPGDAFLDQGMSISYGNSFEIGESSKLGLILAGGYKISYSQEGNTNINLGNSDGALIRRWQFQADNEELNNISDFVYRESSINPVVNGLAGLAYKVNDFNSIDLKLMYNHNTNKSASYFYGVTLDSDPSFLKSRAKLFEEREMINYQLSGQHVLTSTNNLEIKWNLGLVNSTLDEPLLRFFTSTFRMRPNGSTTESINPSSGNLPFYFWRELDDQATTAKVDLKLPISFLGNSGGSLKVGGSYFNKTRDFSERRYRVENGASTTDVIFQGDLEEYFQDQNIGVYGVDSSFGLTRYLLGIYPEFATVPANSYDGEKEILATYAMATLNITPKLKTIVGARFETTDIFVESRDTLAADSQRIGSIDVNNLLPSVNLIYALSDEMNLRASFSQTLARPSLREIAPFSSFDPILTQFYIGNPNLSNTDIMNYDLRYEWFFGPGEIFAVSGFYKDFENPITVQFLPSSNLEFIYTNVEEGRISGLEFEIRKKLGFITPALKDFKASANMAFIDSEMTAPKDRGSRVPENRPFQGQSDFLFNGGLSYANRDLGLEATAQINYFSDRMIQISREGTPDIFEKSRTTLDVVVSKQFGPVNIQISGMNLLAPDVELFSTFNGEEYIFERFFPGRDFGLSVSYSL